MNAVNDSDNRKDDVMDLLEGLIEVEKALSVTLEKVEPWLSTADPRKHPHRARVRPIPTSMDQARDILSVARNLAARTSAPAGWNPAAPVVGFSTPNPLPHQLRGGVLASLQLERAKQSEIKKKKQRIQREKQQQQEKEKNVEINADNNNNNNKLKVEPDPKRGEIEQQNKRQAAPPERTPPSGRQQQQQQTMRNQQPKQAVSMNLSDSSSSDDDDDAMDED